MTGTGARGSNCDGSVNPNTSGGFSVPVGRYENSVGRPAPLRRQPGPGRRDAERTVQQVQPYRVTAVLPASAALPSGSLAPDQASYRDGCQWQAQDISVTGNDFVFQPTVIAASAPLTGDTTTGPLAVHGNERDHLHDFRDAVDRSTGT
jgi:hypothetical protein